MSSDNSEFIVRHSVIHHLQHPFKLKRLNFHEVTGKIVYQSVHFPIELTEIKRKIEQGVQFNIDMDTQELTRVNYQEDTALVTLVRARITVIL